MTTDQDSTANAIVALCSILGALATVAVAIWMIRDTVRFADEMRSPRKERAMPIKRTLRDASLVGAEQYIPDAARAEGLKPKALEGLWMGLTESARNGLINHAREHESSFQGWLNGFPTILGPLAVKEASGLIRVAVMMTGGTIEEEGPDGDVVVTDTKKAKGAK